MERQLLWQSFSRTCLVEGGEIEGQYTYIPSVFLFSTRNQLIELSLLSPDFTRRLDEYRWYNSKSQIELLFKAVI